MDSEGDRPQKRVWKIYTVVDKPGQQKGIWLEIGVAADNRDGSIGGKLDCLPVNGAIQIREFEPRQNGAFRRNSNNQSREAWQEGGNER
ncbi:MAG: hypothetical protein JRF63_01980 [Deltaproteobacteria bacterium]|nr:hypothetical protein [Deltaproteobacteria bacterium]